jgi:trimethylamine--corrinoid protein Co-methyltransferase
MIGALSGINMISGAGMVNSLLCQSAEKLVLDSESIAMAHRMLQGINTSQTHTFATEFFEGIDFQSSGFLKQRVTQQLYKTEQNLPGLVIDRGSLIDWQNSGQMDAFARAHSQVEKMVSSYRRPNLNPRDMANLTHFVQNEAEKAGLPILPALS